MFSVVVTRDRTEAKGPGTLQILDGNDDAIYECRVITGGDKLDPAEYGGVTPPIVWTMVEMIERRAHPQGHMMTMARLFPADSDEAAQYSKRTYALDGWPFMVHRAGTSTGCVAVVKDEWDEARGQINQAWVANGGYLEIEVREG